MRKNNGSHDDVVAVGDVNGFHVQVLRKMTERGMDYVYRILKDDKIVKYADEVYDTIETAFDGAVQWIIPDAEPITIDEIPEKMFDDLNLMLVANVPGGAIKSLAEAVIVREKLAIDFEAAKVEAEQALRVMSGLVRTCIDTQGPLSTDAVNAASMLKLLEHLLNMALSVTDRDLTVLTSFIDAVLGNE